MEKKNWLQLAQGAGTNLIMGQAMDLLDGVLDRDTTEESDEYS